MDFDFEKDISLFDEFFKKRPEINPQDFKKDLEEYYLPFAKTLINLKGKKGGSDGLVVGISAIQGAGKTTQGEVLEILLNHFGFSSVSLSIDDHYITHLELVELREADPRFIRRGVTHDIPLAMRDLENLKTMESPILISGYDKGVQDGDGDRFRWVNLEQGVRMKGKVKEKTLTINSKIQTVKAIELLGVTLNDQDLWLPPNMGSDIPLVEPFLSKELLEFLLTQDEVVVEDQGEQVIFKGQGEILVNKKDLPEAWRVVSKKCDFIFYDGWMLGARCVSDESVFESGLPALDNPEHIEFAKYINQKLLNYEQLWAMLEFMNVLYVINYQDSLKWREQAEEVLRAKGEGMSTEEIKEFVYYFWRSVHPAIHIKNLAEDEKNTNQVVLINDDHSIGDILTPKQLKEKNI